ncbi:MAG: DUF5615 family PIN-like protein [Saprospiraceae bacterium]|nr:DUF5615 family PIN-like protein [Saprospiraceae bacterium]
MKLLLDANLSWRMVPPLKSIFDDCLHVDEIGLASPARDRDIWDYAKVHNLIIVTNDEDFIDLMNISGFPPKVILLKTGNQRKEIIINLLIEHLQEIRLFYNSPDSGLLEMIKI